MMVARNIRLGHSKEKYCTVRTHVTNKHGGELVKGETCALKVSCATFNRDPWEKTPKAYTPKRQPA